MRIADREINDHAQCYVIAEVGHNHQGDLDQCKRLFAAAKDAGACAVKLQKRENVSLFTSAMFAKPYDNPNSFGATYGEHREFLEFGLEEYVELKAYCQQIGIHFFATAFDIPSVAFLEEVDLPAYKVASADVTNVPLLRELAQTGKPVILSTGGARWESIRAGYETLAAGGVEIGILQCTAGYPAAWDELDLRVIHTYRDAFPESVVGLSSHDNGIAMSTAAFALGARIIEKHFTLDRTMKGTDHSFSLEPQGMSKLVRDLTRVHLALGDGVKRVHESEKAPIEKMGKSICAATDLPEGHVLRSEDLAFKSPGGGLLPSEHDTVVGGRLTRAVFAETSLDYELVELPEHVVAARS
ncbi:MAG: N-acetylneuraminate synthase family protein [Solirubrobacteraceae bacterium]